MTCQAACNCGATDGSSLASSFLATSETGVAARSGQGRLQPREISPAGQQTPCEFNPHLRHQVCSPV